VGAPLVDHGEPDDGPPRAVWQSGPAAEHLAWLQAMVEDGLATSVGDSGCCDDLLAILQGRAAMTVHTSGSLVEMIDEVPGGDANIGVAPLPGPGAGSLPGGAALWLSAGRPREETAAAWALAAFLASPPAQARLAAATGYVPVTAGATSVEPLASAWAANPELAVAFDVLAAQPGTEEAQGLCVGPEEDIKHEVADAVERVVAGQDPHDALREVAGVADELLAAYWQQSPAAGVRTPASSPRRRSRTRPAAPRPRTRPRRPARPAPRSGPSARGPW
jgi:sn-glycerol 3-phosphate transport system substrate-binding protein